MLHLVDRVDGATYLIRRKAKTQRYYYGRHKVGDIAFPHKACMKVEANAVFPFYGK